MAETAALHEKGEAGLWRDPDLQLALDWQEKNKPNEYWARRYHANFQQAMAFLETSRQERDREAVEKQRQQRLMRRMTVALFSLSLLALAGFIYLVHHAREIDREAQDFEKKAIEQADEKISKANEAANAIIRQATAQSAAADAKAHTAIEDANNE